MSENAFTEETEDELEEVAEESENDESEEDNEERAALYTDYSVNARTTLLLRDMKNFFHGLGGEISNLIYRGQELADLHWQDNESTIGRELDNLVDIVALGEDAPEKCWDTVDTLMNLPH
jgi:hypothetical protein